MYRGLAFPVPIRVLGTIVACCAPLLTACGGLFPSSKSGLSPSPPPSDPTPLAKCQIAANSSSPLVTEWPASEKAHLQSMAGSRVVAVEYSGCELRIVDSCPLTGGYQWSRTTLATDMVEIQSSDDLYAKLPIGAVGLEGELARSGRLAVRSTVSGQLNAKPIDATELTNTGCHQATHYIAAISVGAFQLLSGTDDSGSGGVSVGNAGAGMRSSRREVVLREAGVRETCAESTDQAPHVQCGSPIQLFLAPLPDRGPAVPAPAAAVADPNRAAAIHISFPKPDDEDEVWTLRAPGGKVLCTLPCEEWVGPVSGDYLQREPRNGQKQAVLALPQSFAHPVGSRVTAEFQAERGNPTLARMALWGAIPTGIMGVGLTTWGIVQAAQTCEDLTGAPDDCFPPAGFLIGTGAFFMLMSAGGIWWNSYSREERFNTYETLGSTRGEGARGVRVMLTADGFAGTFW
jgi:hypothetical protein